ncbi:plasmid partitioning protein RepB [Ancylobacter dichloromethanicus]|uniref:Plasmid partitioning protein RepB n=1 Tax=Ancylobacter dichloromethanicus TaxID=518825 RepID=A0A9W6N0X7_9HYPH|nr:plasmid partitioning protein RepB [Ancylobacter dichloromethanicus]MBS7554830.1 plasmid partitioning protein RepB [Ancylobacter dichloromethanicus]GLK74274.1 plasmid partitioning protein RepB [Ancylobacter dichloromethanicus]
MARKISFDLPVAEPHASQEAPTAVPTSKVRPLLGLDRSLKQPGALGAISQTLGGMSEKVKRADELEKKLVEGQTIVDLDPAVVDNSFVPDRMEASAAAEAAFRDLIREYGQNSPILVRPHPEVPDRFQVAFGHRRLRAARSLGIKVRAVVRVLSDDELVVAQGQENSGRTDLTFIERARFAARLLDRKFSRETIMAALNVDKAALSRLITVATRVPLEVIEAIGAAPGFGRVRWQELTDLLEQDDNRRRALAHVKAAGFQDLESDKRFESIVSAIRTTATRSRPEPWSATDGTHAARVMRNGKKTTLTFDDRVAPRFGDFVREKLQSLYDEYKATEHDS